MESPPDNATTTPPNQSTTQDPPPPATPPRNACNGHSRSRLGLGVYLSHPPSSFPPNTIIYENADFVAIHDKFPKSTIHTLLLPRSPAHNLLHPFEAFQDEQFLRQVQQQVAYLKSLVAKELQRRLGRYSRAERARQAVLDGEGEWEGEIDAEEMVEEDAREGRALEPGSLPPGRDWEAEVISGVHAVPSMSHLHIHVLSRDMHSESMKHRKHYNSFNTPFLVDVMDWGARGETGLGRELSSELRCWRCGKGFGNGFKKLKEHLEEEFLAWRSL
ncbi:hypothetical protein E4U13_001872 [Claviceps humidiphila]|uniref:Uncharacterized protein n=1 Tax=Claviceps humidiphila TaxID=1294629 RepID=A0A9P7Q209_9HYPO|nr:hypothetical protein E4U13_001872 [Claviceps humidiphila]